MARERARRERAAKAFADEAARKTARRRAQLAIVDDVSDATVGKHVLKAVEPACAGAMRVLSPGASRASSRRIGSGRNRDPTAHHNQAERLPTPGPRLRTASFANAPRASPSPEPLLSWRLSMCNFNTNVTERAIELLADRSTTSRAARTSHERAHRLAHLGRRGFFFHKSQNLFHFFDESQSEKIGRKMRIEFRYASE